MNRELSAYDRGIPMEWCLRMARLEVDAEIGAGEIAGDPLFVEDETCRSECRSGTAVPQKASD